MKNIKQAFTLFELIIVIILVGIIYYLAISNFNPQTQKEDTITLTNLKQTLSSIEFEDTISLKCIDNEEVECFISIDNEVPEEKFTGLFKRCPEVYEYSKEQKLLEFPVVKLENLEQLDICFEYTLYKNGNSSQMFIDTGDEVIIYDNISNKPNTIKYINDMSLYFDDKNNEVKNAF